MAMLSWVQACCDPRQTPRLTRKSVSMKAQAELRTWSRAGLVGVGSITERAAEERGALGNHSATCGSVMRTFSSDLTEEDIFLLIRQATRNKQHPSGLTNRRFSA